MTTSRFISWFARKLKCVVIVLALTHPTLSFAEIYKVIAGNKSQMILAGADGIVSRPRGVVQLWAVTIRAPDHLLFGDVAVIKMLYEFDCAASVSRFGVMTTYRKDYSLIKTNTFRNRLGFRLCLTHSMPPWSNLPAALKAFETLSLL